MKKIYSTFMMLAMIVAALSFTACSSSSDDDNQGGNGDIWGVGGDATLVVNEQKCNPNEDSYINQDRKSIQISGKYISDKNVFYTWEIGIRIIRRPFKVAELNEGETINYDEMQIEEFRHGNEINLFEAEYTMLSGSITVESVNNKQVKLRFNDLTFELRVESSLYGDYYPENPKKNIVSGTALFHNHLYYQGDWEPFY